MTTSGPADFEPTSWSAVRHARNPADPKYRAAAEKLCAAYRRPLYVCIRRKGWSPHDADDAVQTFLPWFLEKGLLERVDGTRGRFRAFLLAVLDRFLANEYRRARRERRLNDAPVLSTDFQEAEEALGIDPADPATPEQAFLREWAETVIAGAFDTLCREYEARGLRDRYDAIHAYLIDPNDRPSYDDLARTLGIGVADVQNFLQRGRARLREIICDLLRDHVDETASLEDEINDLFDAL
jgi:RNA polymerase sigma-70 factor (ECF subfamily)